MEMKKKNINNNAPVVLCIFLNMRNTLACFFLLPIRPVKNPKYHQILWKNMKPIPLNL